ncbi:MAG: hypothetical protein JW772_01495 [Candidatus Diapherotrites archaeon]|nr:hypothetical protein [Candidatus Diapherotrites archaeon]
MRGQVAVEFLIAATIAIIMLLLGTTLFVQNNEISNRLIAASQNAIVCNKIADAISEIHTSSSGATASQSISIDMDVRVFRQPGDLEPGQVSVGETGEEYYCNYFGEATFNDGGTIRDDDVGAGFTLTNGRYKVTREAGTVVFYLIP